MSIEGLTFVVIISLLTKIQRIVEIDDVQNQIINVCEYNQTDLQGSLMKAWRVITELIRNTC